MEREVRGVERQWQEDVTVGTRALLCRDTVRALPSMRVIFVGGPRAFPFALRLLRACFCDGKRVVWECGAT